MTTVEDVKPLDRAKVTGWVRDLFGHDRIVSATFHKDDTPRAEVTVPEITQGRIGQELCDLLGIDPAKVQGVDLDTRGAFIVLNDIDEDGCQALFIPFGD